MIFSRHRHAIHDDHSGNRLFRRLVNDYRKLYISAAELEDKGVVVEEVVRLWRSREPPGRFLERTESAPFPLHDIGDDDARRRISQLLQRGNGVSVKHRDDVTASTAESSTVHNMGENTVATRAARNAPRQWFGGSFRGLVLNIFAGSSKDSIMNQYLP